MNVEYANEVIPLPAEPGYQWPKPELPAKQTCDNHHCFKNQSPYKASGAAKISLVLNGCHVFRLSLWGDKP
jgi:hypothetical protein